MDKQTPTQFNFKGFDDFIEVFRAGEHIASDGTKLQFSTDDLDQMVANHNADNPAPHVITHKELYAPFAYAQNDEVKREGDKLFVKAKKVNPDFARLVENGNLYERSLRVQKTENGWKIGHVAWLGAEPPALEGMAPVSFSASDDGYDFAVDTTVPGALSRMMRSFRDFIIDKFSRDDADKILPDWEIQSVEEHVHRLRAQRDDELAAEFNQNPDGGMDMGEFTQEQLDAAVKKAVEAATEKVTQDFQAQLDGKELDLSTERNKRLVAEFQADIDDAIEKGQLLPAQVSGMADFMLQIPDGDNACFEFSQGEGDKKATVKVSPRQWFRDFVSNLGKQIELGESGAGDDFEASAAGTYDAPAGTKVDPDRLALHNKALNYQRQHNVSYVDAVMAIEQEA